MATRKFYLETLTCKENKINRSKTVLLEALLSPLFQSFFSNVRTLFRATGNLCSLLKTVLEDLTPDMCTHMHTHTEACSHSPKWEFKQNSYFPCIPDSHPIFVFLTEFSLLRCFGLTCGKLELQRFLGMFFQNPIGSLMLQMLERTEMKTCTRYSEASWLAEHFSTNRLIFYNIWNPSNYPRTGEWVQDVGRIWKAVVPQ